MNVTFFDSLGFKINHVDNPSKKIDILTAINCLLDFSMNFVQNRKLLY